ncbi:Alpha/Beta hydrolase protein [Kalaharituber pfeilii]|nr:Alpha/Beta hydrolase protein [Kalaharituber pfeilii]
MRAMLAISYLLCVAFLIIPLSLGTPAPPTPTVIAPFGKIIGQPSRLEPSVHEYLGISYAYPPTESRRFAPPLRLPNRSGPIMATEFGVSCPSLPPYIDITPFFPYNLTGRAEGEDCLSVNIWTKPGRANAPVMVWIHGGGFMQGTSDTNLYDGAYFVANNEVVIVTLNYRMNVFGFPNSPAVKTENLGILDQRMALEWIRDNIAAFGGNPKRITIFGESAGGVSVDIHAHAWARDPIVSGLIAQSGAVGLIPFLDGGDRFHAWGNLTDKVGCANAGSEQQKLKCMQQVPWRELIKGLQALQTCDDPFYFGFGPRVDGKMVFSASEYQRRGALGWFAKVPLLVGNTDDEVGGSATLTPPLPSCPPRQPVGDVRPEVLGKLLTSSAFSCPAREAAVSRFLNNVPVWRYRYYGSFNSGVGAVHGAELPVMFGAALQRGNVTARDEAFIKYMQSMWTAFATDPSSGLRRPPFNLPAYNPSEPTLIRLDYEGELEASTTHPINYDYLCSVIGPDRFCRANAAC